jgi:hypothetical protein
VGSDWRTAQRDSAGLVPRAGATPEAVIQLYAARAFNWYGAFAVHTWLAVKAPRAQHYLVHQVLGWNLYGGRSVVDSRPDLPDRYWYDAAPEIVAEVRGARAAALLSRVEDAVARYPYSHRYQRWPGPNSNTFTAFVARAVPELGFALPSTAIGKDFFPGGALLLPAPSGRGWQFSLGGLVGVMLAPREGLELNVLGAVFGIDFMCPALKLPGLGRLGLRS